MNTRTGLRKIPQPNSSRTRKVVQKHISTNSPVCGKDQQEVVFIVNPAARNGRTKTLWRQFSTDLRSHFGPAYKVTGNLTEYPRHAELIAKQAVERRAAVVVAVGGDGTLHEVVHGMMSSACNDDVMSTCETALALWPLGTGSDFARNWGWSGSMSEAVARITSGQRQPIDVGHVICTALSTGDGDGEGDEQVCSYFINVSSVGLSARAAMCVSAFKWMGRFAYEAAVALSFLSHRNTTLTISLDKQQPAVLPHVTLLAVANGAYFGGGARVAPAASPASNTFQVVSLCRKSILDFLLYRNAIKAGDHMALPHVTAQAAQHVEVDVTHQGAGGMFLVEADGELLGRLPATWEIKHGALNIMV